ncbi:hypothetical protein [Asaia astilbis]|uniref:hypothetical protein n=1 Tax=Asaia astilbis TaxID=610244 RepID=UPI00047154B7|nr:hypothetical protein [Asaia astilbis]
MSADISRYERDVLRAIDKLTATLKKENALLTEGRAEAVADLLEDKAQQIEGLERALRAFVEAGGDKKALREPLEKFVAKAGENQSLIEHSVEAQMFFLKLLFSEPEEDGVRGYSASGGYAASSPSSEALTLRSDV